MDKNQILLQMSYIWETAYIQISSHGQESNFIANVLLYKNSEKFQSFIPEIQSSAVSTAQS